MVTLLTQSTCVYTLIAWNWGATVWTAAPRGCNRWTSRTQRTIQPYRARAGRSSLPTSALSVACTTVESDWSPPRTQDQLFVLHAGAPEDHVALFAQVNRKWVRIGSRHETSPDTAGPEIAMLSHQTGTLGDRHLAFDSNG